MLCSPTKARRTRHSILTFHRPERLYLRDTVSLMFVYAHSGKATNKGPQQTTAQVTMHNNTIHAYTPCINCCEQCTEFLLYHPAHSLQFLTLLTPPIVNFNQLRTPRKPDWPI